MVPIALGHISVGNILHATSLVARKKNGIAEFVFMDPLNWKFTEHQTYKNILEPIVRFTSDLDYAKKTLVRAGYLGILRALKDTVSHINQEKIALQFFHLLTVVEKLNLLNDDFFNKHYKKRICGLINDKLSGVFPSIEITLKGMERPSYPDAKSELLKRYSCN